MEDQPKERRDSKRGGGKRETTVQEVEEERQQTVEASDLKPAIITELSVQTKSVSTLS